MTDDNNIVDFSKFLKSRADSEKSDEVIQQEVLEKIQLISAEIIENLISIIKREELFNPNDPDLLYDLELVMEFAAAALKKQIDLRDDVYVKILNELRDMLGPKIS